MTKDLKRKVEKGNYEVMLIDKNLSSKIKRLSKTMKTTPSDVMDSALNIMEKGMGREIIVRDNKLNLIIKAFKKLKPQVPLTN